MDRITKNLLKDFLTSQEMDASEEPQDVNAQFALYILHMFLSM